MLRVNRVGILCDSHSNVAVDSADVNGDVVFDDIVSRAHTPGRFPERFGRLTENVARSGAIIKGIQSIRLRNDLFKLAKNMPAFCSRKFIECFLREALR